MRLYIGMLRAEELTRACEQAKSNILMGLESTSSRMNRLGRSELTLGRIPDIDEIIEEYNKITAEDIRSLAQQCFDFDKVSLSAVGRVKPADEYRSLIEL